MYYLRAESAALTHTPFWVLILSTTSGTDIEFLTHEGQVCIEKLETIEISDVNLRGKVALSGVFLGRLFLFSVGVGGAVWYCLMSCCATTPCEWSSKPRSITKLIGKIASKTCRLMIWHDMIWCGTMCYDITWQVWYGVMWCDMIRYDVIVVCMWYHMMWCGYVVWW